MSDTIYSKPGATFYSELNNAPTGLVGVVGVRILRKSDSAEVLARTTKGIIETPAGSGHYVATLTAPSATGDYTVFWDTGEVTPETTASDDLVVTFQSLSSLLAPSPPSSPGVVPGLTGFRDASERLRNLMGNALVYLIPSPTVWPEDAVLDPESGEPFDPAIAPLASGFASAAVNTLVVMPGGNDRVAKEVEAAIGRIEEGEAALIISSFDWDSQGLEGATLVQIYDDTWELADARYDSVGGNLAADRVIVHARQRSRTMNPEA